MNATNPYKVTSKNSTAKIVLVLVLITIFALLGFRIAERFSGSNDDVAIEPRIPVVNLITVDGEGGTSVSSVTTIGEVKAGNRAELRAQLPNTISQIRISIGQRVSAGQVLATQDNASLVADRQRFQAALDAEEAALADTKRGTRQEQLAVYESQLASAEVAFANAQIGLLNAIRSGYTLADDAIYNDLDTFFTNPRDPLPQLIFLPFNSQIKIDLERDRPVIGNMLTNWQGVVNSLTTTSDVTSLAIEANANLVFLRNFVDTLSVGVNSLTPSNAFPEATLSGWRANVAGIRTGINGAITALLGSGDAFTQSQANLEVAKNQLALAQAGATDEQITIQESRVASAQASLDSLNTQIAKTIFRAPFSGIVGEVPFDVGDLINPGDLVATVVNTNSHTIQGFVSTDDVSFIAIGSAVVIEGAAEGRVVHISPTVNSQSRKVEISISVDNKNDLTLIDGSFVDLAIETVGRPNLLPLSAIRTELDSSWVFSIDEDGKLAPHQVVLGDIFGENVEVTSGLTELEMIVENIRGLDEGSVVRTM